MAKLTETKKVLQKKYLKFIHNPGKLFKKMSLRAPHSDGHLVIVRKQAIAASV